MQNGRTINGFTTSIEIRPIEFTRLKPYICLKYVNHKLVPSQQQTSKDQAHHEDRTGPTGTFPRCTS